MYVDVHVYVHVHVHVYVHVYEHVYERVESRTGMWCKKVGGRWGDVHLCFEFLQVTLLCYGHASEVS